MINWRTGAPPEVVGESERVFVNTELGIVTAVYDYMRACWDTKRGLNIFTISGWCYQWEILENWHPFKDRNPTQSGFYNVWDTRINRPRMIEFDHQSGMMMEENGRTYDLVHNLFYSHWSRVCVLPVPKPE